MQSRGEIERFLLAHAAQYPALEVDDLIKALYQSAFGCGHFAPGEEQVLAYLSEELSCAQADPSIEAVEPILGRYARVNIVPCINSGLHPRTLARLFMRTADEAPQEDAHAWFEDALCVLETLIGSGALPFDAQTAMKRLAQYRAQGCPSLHHSSRFHSAYHPAYRVLRSDYAQLLPVFERIDRALEEKERVIVAIDGNSGSGKSTLADLIAKVYDDSALVHMDDFFLQMHQRTQERFDTPGGNVDHERFLYEVLAPMRRGEAICYRPFDCGRMQIAQGKTMHSARLCIVEGSYSLHQTLEDAYDVRIVLAISPAAQVERILARNGAAMLSRFINEWIPMENRYFEATQIAGRCDLLIGVTPLAGGIARYDVRKMEGRA